MRITVRTLLWSGLGAFLVGAAATGLELIAIRSRAAAPLVELARAQAAAGLLWLLVTVPVVGLWTMWRGNRAEPAIAVAGRSGLMALTGWAATLALFEINAVATADPLAAVPLLLDALLGAAAIGLVAMLLRSRQPAMAAAGMVLIPIAAIAAVAAPTLFTVYSKGATPDAGSARADAPNVLVVLVDTLRADHLGCYGYARPTSPAIDAFAASSSLFLSCQAASSWTRPSTVSVLSGTFPCLHGQYYDHSVIPPSVPMATGVFHRAGYRTAFFTENPVVSRSSGFAREAEHYVGYDLPAVHATAVYYALRSLTRLTGRAGLGVRFEAPLELVTGRGQPARIAVMQSSAIDELLLWLDRPDPRPFFAYLHCNEPHTPHTPPPPFEARFIDPDYDDAEVWEAPVAPGEFVVPPLARARSLPAAQLDRLVDRYDAEIASFDAQFGAMLVALGARGLLDRTIVVLTADHGEEFYDHGGWHHGHSLFEELTHVPLVIKSAGSVAPRPVPDLVRHVDILPTVLELAGLPPSPGAQGVSLVPLIEGRGRPPTWATSDVIVQGRRITSLRLGNHKVVEIGGSDGMTLAFDLERDPGESSGWSATRENPMVQQMASVLAELSKGAWRSRSRQLSADEIHRLRSLGYLAN